jgi:hypothetical protein
MDRYCHQGIPVCLTDIPKRRFPSLRQKQKSRQDFERKYPLVDNPFPSNLMRADGIKNHIEFKDRQKIKIIGPFESIGG